MTAVTIGFLPKPILVPVGNILPSRKLSEGLAATKKYKQILASIQEVDMIEPLSISAVERRSGQHVLLDGHIRLAILKELGRTEAPCLVAIDEESYTYNNRINRLSTIQEHLMICRAADRGLSPERLAKALCLASTEVVKRMNLLVGICPEATEMLKDRQFSVEVCAALRRMKPTRQIESVELMISANNLTVGYARALLVGTLPDGLAQPKKPPQPRKVTQEQIGRMQREMSNLHDQYRIAEQTYGEDTLNLVLARGYVIKLLDNRHVRRYLEQNEPEVLEQFLAIANAAIGEKNEATKALSDR
ncbi:plasmid partitioning protein RepB C-terminal domain-containing protein [Variovorax humicola]|uniref:Plasmid partitioning protein RepB C-terminal domain-containing protein n=1 Tax=Variovorax humicola TaxID=1769758 RepID=A0ABU8W9F2_9BURK